METLEEIIKRTGINSKQIIPLLKERFPKFDKVVYHFVIHPSESGIQLSKEAMKILSSAYPKAVRKTAKPKQKRKKIEVDDDDGEVIKRLAVERGITQREVIKELLRNER